MAIAIKFKKVSVLPSSPIDSSFYFVGDKDVYLGNRKLNNEDDLLDLESRVAAIEGATPGVATKASNIIVEDKDGVIASNNVEDALAEIAKKIGLAGGTFNQFSLVRITPSDWTGKETDGGRVWHTATIGFVECETNIIHAIPCGGTLSEMPTLEEEEVVYAMKGYLYPDDKNIVFYSPVVPDIDVVIAVEGVVLD